MRQSELFTKTTKNAPKDEVSRNSQLLIRGGFINKEMAGVYSFLPLGLRVLNKVMDIIREEINNIGGQEVTMTALQNPEIWKKSDRWDERKVDTWMKTKLKNGTELGLAFTHEEPLANVMTRYINSYKDLPQYVYQFQTKFRNEIRAKSGIMRTREFIMKDLYSFNRDEAEFQKFYDQAAEAYKKIFARIGIGDKTYFTFASGGSFSKFSHEFQTLSPAGEDTVYVDKKKRIAINKEVYTDEVIKEAGLKKDDLVEEKVIEVGNIFRLGTKYSEAMGLEFVDKEGNKNPVFMGSYGIGPARAMGTVVELYNDDRGIMWPETIAPFKVHLISLRQNDAADKLYKDMGTAGIEVLYDDRDDVAPGAKFADVDLIGCPYRAVVSEKTLKEDSVELKRRDSKEFKLVKINEFIQSFKNK